MGYLDGFVDSTIDFLDCFAQKKCERPQTECQRVMLQT
jgi:hypothetical protein